MPFDVLPDEARVVRGERAYQDGLAAEEIACRDYQARGYELLAMRWRGPGGEVDLIFKGADAAVFVEVKKAATHAWAAERLSERQLWRVARSAEAYIAHELDDPFTPMRLDLATVDASGRVAITENLALY
ncbi:MAG: YraN family protein [Pseudomonadota bacterium]